jgi:hypothetical protein
VVQRLGERQHAARCGVFCERRAQKLPLRALRASGFPQIATRRGMAPEAVARTSTAWNAKRPSRRLGRSAAHTLLLGVSSTSTPTSDDRSTLDRSERNLREPFMRFRPLPSLRFHAVLLASTCCFPSVSRRSYAVCLIGLRAHVACSQVSLELEERTQRNGQLVLEMAQGWRSRRCPSSRCSDGQPTRARCGPACPCRAAERSPRAAGRGR